VHDLANPAEAVDEQVVTSHPISSVAVDGTKHDASTPGGWHPGRERGA